MSVPATSIFDVRACVLLWLRCAETAEPAKLNAPSSSTTASSSQQPAAKKRTGRRKAAATKPPTRAPRRLQHDDPFDGMAALSAAPAVGIAN